MRSREESPGKEQDVCSQEINESAESTCFRGDSGGIWPLYSVSVSCESLPLIEVTESFLIWFSKSPTLRSRQALS